MILAYRDLVEGWRSGRLRFNPDISIDQIGLSSIDLRLGWIFTRLLPRPGEVIQPARGIDPTNLTESHDFSQILLLGRTPTFRLPPREFCLAFTLEEITIPNNLAANVQGKSSLSRAGLAVHTTAPHINPGWAGRITLELYNHGPWELELFPGEDLVCQIIYYMVKTPVPMAIANAMGTYIKQDTPFPVRKTGTQAIKEIKLSKKKSKKTSSGRKPL